MSRKSKNQEVTETQDKEIITLSKEAEADCKTIIFELQQITKQSLTENQAWKFIDCFMQVIFWYCDDKTELEDSIYVMSEILTLFAEKIKGGEEDE